VSFFQVLPMQAAISCGAHPLVLVAAGQQNLARRDPDNAFSSSISAHFRTGKPFAQGRGVNPQPFTAH
jgi:hypothetical protein